MGAPFQRVRTSWKIELGSSGDPTSSGEPLTPNDTAAPSGAPYFFLILIGIIVTVVVYLNKRNSQGTKSASLDAKRRDEHGERFSQAVHKMAKDIQNQKAEPKTDE